MALVHLEGYDGETNASLATKLLDSTFTGTGVSSSDTVTSEGQAFIIGAFSEIVWPLPVVCNPFIFQFYYKCQGLFNTLEICSLFYDTTRHLELRLNADGSLYFARNATQIGTATAAGTLSANVWHYIQIKATIDDSAGVAICKLNDITVLNLSSQDTRNGGTAGVNRVQLTGSGAGNNALYDHQVGMDTTGSTNNDFIPLSLVKTIRPNQAGNYTQLTPSTGSNFQCVDDTTTDTSDYVEGQAENAKDSYQLADLGGDVSVIRGVGIDTFAAKTDVGGKTCRTFLRIAGVDYPQPTQALSQTQSFFSSLHDVSPATSSGWGKSEINGAELGLEVIT